MPGLVPNLIGILVLAAGAGVGALAIVGVGRFRAAQEPPGGIGLVRALLEVAALLVISLLPAAILVTFSRLQIPGLDTEHRGLFVTGLLTLSYCSDLFVLPMWFALRLPSFAHPRSELSSWYLLRSAFSYFVVLTTGVLATVWIAGGSNRLMAQYGQYGLAYFGLASGCASTVGFVLVYSLIGVVVVASQRSVVFQPRPSYVQTNPSLRLLLTIAMVGAFFVELTVFTITLRDRADLLFNPGPVLDIANLLGLQPVWQLQWVVWFSLLPSLLVLGFGLFATHHGRNDSTLLFGLLCFLQLLWGLDTYPRWGGIVFWSFDVLAAAVMMPVLLSLFFRFPEGALQIPQTVWRALGPLYGVFILGGAGFAVTVWGEVLSRVLAKQSVNPATLPIMLMTAVISLSSTPVAWFLSLYCVWTAGSMLRTKEPSRSVSTGCRWLDRVTSQGVVAVEQKRALSRRTQYVVRLLAATTAILVAWLLFLPLWATPGLQVLGTILIKGWVVLFYGLIWS